MIMKNVVAFSVIACVATGCMKNECGDGNDQDRGAATVALSRAALNNKLRENAVTRNSQWWWCESTTTSAPPAGSGWMSMTRDKPRNVINAVGGWVRPTKSEAKIFGGDQDGWRAASIVRALDVVGGDPLEIECLSVEERIDELDRFVSCKSPVEHGPVTPGGGSDPTPLPHGSTSGDP